MKESTVEFVLNGNPERLVNFQGFPPCLPAVGDYVFYPNPETGEDKPETVFRKVVHRAFSDYDSDSVHVSINVAAVPDPTKKHKTVIVHV